MRPEMVEVKSILTRTSGFLKTVTSHSLQPYRGCSFGRSLCGTGCYVQHNGYVTRGRGWGSFLEVRTNAAQVYRRQAASEARWARVRRDGFSVFLASSTEPFLPQERTFGITRSVLEAMIDHPPDELVLQTHSATVTDYLDLYPRLAEETKLRFHISIETDRERMPGLPPHASPLEDRFAAAERLRRAGLRVVATVSPLLPIDDPPRFFARLAGCVDAVVIDHFIGGDGSPGGSRTRKTAVPAVMEAVCRGSSRLDYRDAIVEVARRFFPGRVGVNVDGFAGRFLVESA